MAKKNKAAADDWYASQRDIKQREADTEDQKEHLHYATRRKRDWPCPTVLDRLGFVDAAEKVRKAYRLLDEAEQSFRLQQAHGEQPVTI